LILNNLQWGNMMITQPRIARFCAGLLTLLFGAIAQAQGPSDTSPKALPDPLQVRAIAEVESKSVDAGRTVVKLIPADRVVPGDRVIYTLEARNTGATALDIPVVTYAVPDHMRYVADSALGPGAEVSFSIDGGHSFDRAENLKVNGRDGRPRAAVGADITHIRWQLKNSLKANSVAFVRFRALVQ
jgi:uncharacterized repeat protein (TIGR01451 family)